MRRLTGQMVWRVVALAAILAAAVIAAAVIELPDVDTIRLAAADGGVWAAAGFSVVYAVVTLTPVPKNLVSIAAGVVWGLPVGFVIVYAGAIAGAAAGFGISRVLGRAVIERLTGARMAAIDRALGNRGTAAVIGTRLVPVIPFTVLNYAAGLTGVRLRHYLVGTAVGIVPGTAAYIAVGAYGFALGWPFFLAVGILGALTIGGALYAARMRHRAVAGRHQEEGNA